MKGPLNKSTVTVVAEIILGQVLCSGLGIAQVYLICQSFPQSPLPSTLNNSNTKQKSKIAGSYHDVISRRDAHPIREIKGVCHTLGVGVVFPQRGRGKGPLFWVVALSEICPVR